jgi:glutathione S-transferase
VTEIRPKATLYAIPGSHACAAGALMLEHKRIPYRRVDLLPGMHGVSVRVRGFPGYATATRKLDGDEPARRLALADRLGTVPALRLGEERVQTNHAIARRLERLEPEPPLFPADPESRRAVEEAERWGDEELQMLARRLTLAAALHGPDALHDRGGAGRLGPLLWKHDRVRLFGARMLARFVFESKPDNERELLEKLPAMLDRIDAWIADGVLSSEQLNAADLIIAPSLALLCYRRDLRPLIESRPAGALVDRAFSARAGSAGE